MAVPNGSYQVLVVAGDAGQFDSVYRINVEGVPTVSGTPNSSTRWFSGSSTVTVSDGRLTVSNGPGAIDNKICFIDVASVAPIGPAAAAGSDETVRLEWVQRDATGRVTLRVDATAGASYVIEASPDLTAWEPVAVVSAVNGILSFDDAATQNNRQRFYRVRVSR
jgi:hypothetical protein